MTSVNRLSTLLLDDVEHQHLGFLAEAVRRRLARDLFLTATARGWHLGPGGTYPDLRASHLRLLSMLPAAGARATDLSHVAGMTKQGLGQFVGFLEERGYLASEPDPADRRARVLRRTPLGDDAVARTDQLYAEVADRWRDLLGQRRWEEFVATLRELALGWDAPDSEDFKG